MERVRAVPVLEELYFIYIESLYNRNVEEEENEERMSKIWKSVVNGFEKKKFVVLNLAITKIIYVLNLNVNLWYDIISGMI